ncbi:MAG TPA: TetR/AcrR family transcriptional regulator [Acidimicrobiales bacterium]|nr:TetR/AcrR family transcriptional regulator [Acidimicrobiales bacterium]
MTRAIPATRAASSSQADPEAEGVSPRGTLNDRRWQEVLDAASALFEEKGYQATTLQDVASRVQLLAPSLYYYIKTKEDLLFSVMKRAHQLGLALLDEPGEVAGADAETRLAAFIRQWMGGTYPPQIRVVERDIRFLSEERQAEVLAWRDRMNHFVADIIRQGIDEGVFDESTDPTVAASTLFVVLNATPTWFREPGRVSYTELTDWYTRLFLQGMGGSSA